LKLAAIDVGSNSIKLLVAEATDGDSFAALARAKEVVRLGHDTLREGLLKPKAIKRAAKTIRRFREIADALGAQQVLAIATASVREARNAAEFIEEVERRTGVRVRVLSGIEEARLIGIAAASGCADAADETILNLDIGGGSTEISLVRDGVPAKLYSVKLGSVGLTERFISTDPPSPQQLDALREEVRAALVLPCGELRGASWQLATGTSGTILAIGEALRLTGVREPDPRDAPPPGSAEIVFSRLERFNIQTAALRVSERYRLPGVSRQRAEILVAGGQILEAAMRALLIGRLRTCVYALREGVVIDALRRSATQTGGGDY
jgi:exopolyphosphatase/guanosine-5'-triphosphate,3'-diphosphate pyrophosphatase